MKWFVAVMCMVASTLGQAQDHPYVRLDGHSATIGNAAMEREIDLRPGAMGTSRLVNRLSGECYDITSDEVKLEMVFAGFGPAPGKAQNGENPTILSLRDLDYLGAEQSRYGADGKELVLKFRYEAYRSSLRLDVHYTVRSGDFSMRKWVVVSDSSDGMHFLEHLILEQFTFTSSSFSHGEFGQPVLYADLFFGVEYPSAENLVRGNSVECKYLLGKPIGHASIVSETAVLGVAQSHAAVESQFMRYVDSVKVKGTRPFLLYNSWYDLRHPTRVEIPANGMTEKTVLQRIGSLEHALNVRGLSLDAFVLDDGWDNTSSIWDIDTTIFPRRLTPVAEALAARHTTLGLWASPFCGYDGRELRVAWGSAHGYEKTGDFLCFAGDKYRKEFKRKMLEYVRKYNVGYYKWDGFLLACNEPNHGHLPGVYSREALIATFREMMEGARAINPDIFINITVGSWLSPWWLKYADCVWMQGADYGFAEQIPSRTPRDMAISYRDAVLWDDLRGQHLLFPMSSLMTHGIIRGDLNMLGGKNESLTSFANEVIMYVGRGVMMWELYISPDALNNREWEILASSLRWAKENSSVLSHTAMILGNPIRREPYGYVHLTPAKGIVLFRNPAAGPSHVEFVLADSLGQLASGTAYVLHMLYPYNIVLPGTYRPGDRIDLPLDPYEVVLAELLPAATVPSSTPVGIRYEATNDRLALYGDAGTTNEWHSLGGRRSTVSFPEGGTALALVAGDMRALSDSSCELIAIAGTPEGSGSAEASFLFEADSSCQNSSLPGIRVSVNGVRTDPAIENGGSQWWWISVPVVGRHDTIAVQLSSSTSLRGTCSTWLFTERQLEKVEQTLAGARTLPSGLDAGETGVRKSAQCVSHCRVTLH